MKMTRRCLVVALAALGLTGSAFATPAMAADGDPFVRACRSGVNAPAFAGCAPNVRGRVIGSVLSPDGKHLYVGLLSDGNPNTFNGIQAYTRNTSTGALTQGRCYSGAAFTGCTTVPGLQYGFDMKFDPDGETLYHASEGAATLFSFRRDAGTGGLTPLPCFGAATGCTPITPNNGVTAVAATAGHVYARVSDAIVVFQRNGSTGVLTPVNCVSETGGACTDVVGIADSGWRLDVSGSHLYATSSFPGGVAVFTRSGDNLTQPTAGAFGGCISSNGFSGGAAAMCVDGADSLATALSVEVSPTGNAVYVGSDPGVTAYSRNATSGLLTQTDCVTESPMTGCDDGTGVSSTYDLDVTPNGSDLIAGSYGSSAVSFFRRASNGALTQRSGRAGCMSQSGSGGACQTVPALSQFTSVQPASNSRDVYITGYINGLVGHVERNFAPSCPSPTVGVGHNTPTRVSLRCTDLNGDPITYVIARAPSNGFAGAPDQGSASVVYSPFSGFVGADSFDFRATDSRSTSTTKRVTLNVAGPAPGPGPSPGPGPGPGPGPSGPLPIVPSSASFSSLTFARFTKFVNLSANNLPAGSSVNVRCKTRRRSAQRRGCPRAKTYRTATAKRRLNLRKPFKSKRVPHRSRITITINAPGFRGKRITFTTRKGKRPSSRVQCASPTGRFGSCI